MPGRDACAQLRGSQRRGWKRTYTFVPVALHTLQQMQSDRNARVRAFLTNESGAVDGDVSGGGTRPQREVRLIRLRLGRRLEADPDVSGYGAEV